MSEAQEYQKIRKYWKEQRNRYQRRQTRDMDMAHGKQIVICVGDKTYVSPKLDDETKRYHLCRAHKNQDMVSQYQLLLNKFEVQNEKKTRTDS